MSSPAPKILPREGLADQVAQAIGEALIETRDALGELSFTVRRDDLVDTMRTLRDRFDYQQLMDIAGVDYPNRQERFEVVYSLLSLNRNHRVRVRVSTDESKPVPSITGLWPVAGWFEREAYDMYGILFEGNPDLRRILTDYGFRGHPFRKDFPLPGYVEMRYSEEHKRVVYEPVKLAQDFRNFDFMSPWEGAEYVLPGDEKAKVPEAKGAPTPLSADEIAKAGKASTAAPPQAVVSKTTESPAQTGAGQDHPGNRPQEKPAHPEGPKPAPADKAQPETAEPPPPQQADTSKGAKP